MIDQLWDEIDEASAAPEKMRARLIPELVRRIELLPNYNRSATLAYMVAYCWYMHPERIESAELQAKFDFAVDETLRLDSQHALARLYRGFNLFDTDRLTRADAAFSTVALSELTVQQRIKVLELQTCIALRTQGLSSTAIERLDRFMTEAKAADEYDVLPVQLARTLMQVKASGTDETQFSQLVENYARFLSDLGQQDIFSDELRALRA